MSDDQLRCTSATSLDSYGLAWLFDQERNDHLSIEEQLGYYQQRELFKSKLFKISCSIFGDPKSRKRVIIADNVECKDPVHSGQWSKDLPPNKPESDPSCVNEKLKEAQEKNDANFSNYKNFVDKRKQFRKNLDSMGLSENWLRRKPDKTPLEQRILKRMVHDRTQRYPPPAPVETEPKHPILSVKSKRMKSSAALALQIIERFLYQRKLRLIDLFKAVDKNKDWRISQDEFRNAIKEAGIPLSPAMLDDLILALDINNDSKLNYQEFAIGLGSWKVEKRDTKHQKVHSVELSKAPEKVAQVLGFELPDVDDDDDVTALSERVVENEKQCGEIPSEAVARRKTSCAQSKTRSIRSKSLSSKGSCSLDVPPPNLGPDKMVLPSVEQIQTRATMRRMSLSVKKVRRQSIAISSKTMSKIGDTAVDRHLMPTTMVGDPEPLINKFRQLKYNEYKDLCKICRIDKDVRLNEKTLKKVLLYPEDRSPSQMKKHIRYPAMPLLSKSEVLRSPTYHKDFTHTRSIP